MAVGGCGECRRRRAGGDDPVWTKGRGAQVEGGRAVVVERFELQARALEDTARAWEVLSEVLAISADEVGGAGASGGGAASTQWGPATADFWSAVQTGVEEARTLTQGWADDLRAVLADVTHTEATIVADLSAIIGGRR